MNESIRREEEIFTGACALPTEQRHAFLQRTCADDPALLRHVGELLRVAGEMGAFLEAPPLHEAATGGGHHGPAEPAGQRIGRYALVRKLGEGGAGIVYEAEQMEPVRRRVALKLMKAGTDTEAAVARFEAERQALALMEHPNIARVFDAGATESGRLYFAMELVEGVRITEYCDQNRLSTAARLELFIQVCHAVQHAHHKGVIHRDIKPSNVLVAQIDGKPAPKVIDFGIAKATQGALSDAPQITLLDQLVGTPAYMSPEQADFGAHDVDTRTDIYSLGVLLYELLTGCTPFDARELAGAGIDAVREAIHEREPARPSARLGGTESSLRAGIAARRDTNAGTLVHALRGDLDWIVLKALEKDRSRRYATASEVAADLERHLREEAVLARPPGAWYLFRKFARRNRTAVVAVTVVFVALALGLVAALAGYRRAAAARATAVAARDESEAVTRFFTDLLHQAHPWVGGAQRDLSVRTVLDAAAASVDQRFGARPTIELRIRESIADTYHGLTLYDQAAGHAMAAMNLSSRLHGADDAETLRLTIKAADMEHYRGDPVSSEALARQALALYERSERYPGADRLNALGVLATSLTWQGRMGPALAVAEERMALARSFLAADAADWFDLRRELAYHESNAGQCMAARQLFIELLAAPGAAQEPQTRARLLFEAATNEVVIGDFERAVSLAREASELGDRWFGPDYTETIFPHITLAHALAFLGRASEGVAEAEAAATTLRTKLGAAHLYTIRSDANLAFVLSQCGRHADAVACASVAEQWMRANIVFGLYGAADQAIVLIGAGRASDGEALCRTVLAGCNTLGWRDEYRLAAVERSRAAALLALGRVEEAEAVLREIHARLSALGDDMSDQLNLTREAARRAGFSFPPATR